MSKDPNDNPNSEEASSPSLLDLPELKIIVTKITADPYTNGQATEETEKAVADLCKIFAPREGEIIQTGLHCPLGILNGIFKVYDTYFFNPWRAAQLAFFSRTVIGGAIAALTAVDGQCVKNGLTNLNMEGGPDRRDSLFGKHPRGIPEDEASLADELGKTMFADPYDGHSCFVSSARPSSFDYFNKNGGWGPHVGLAGLRAGLENLWRTKAAAYGSYYAAEYREVKTLSR